MWELFVRKKRGTVSIMLCFLLVAVLSINATFIEIARYRSFERMYKEIEDNAAFSMLSKYDRELFKNYGLLAIQMDKGQEAFIDYVQADLNKRLADPNRIEQMLNLTEEDVDFDKLYDLAQSEVFKEQINEFCAYRAPVSMINNGLNIEGTLKDLIKEVENALPLLELFKNLTEAIKSILEAFVALDEYKESCDELKKQENSYISALGSYNTAVTKRDNYLAEHDPEEEEYEAELAKYNANVKSTASVLQDSIKAAQSALGDFYEKREAFMGGYKKMQDANVKAMIQGARGDVQSISDKEEKKQAEKWLDNMEKAYDASNEDFAKISSKIKQWTKANVQKCVNDLEDQHKHLGESVESLETLEQLKLAKNSIFWDTIELTATTIETIAAIVKEWGKLVAAISDMVKVFGIITTGGFYDLQYNNNLDNGYYKALSGVMDSGYAGMVLASNKYRDTDAVIVNKQMEKTQEIAKSVDFDTSIIPQAGVSNENNALQVAMQNMSIATQKIIEAIGKLGSSMGWRLITKLKAIINVVGALLNFLICAINLVVAFIQAGNPDFLSIVIYQKLYPAVYTVEMFSNRATDVASSKRMNGSSFPDMASYIYSNESESSYFDQANVEYVLTGGLNEISNQEAAFRMILAFRVLCNLPAILSDETLMETVEGLSGTLIGIPVAIILVVAMLVAEAWADMIFMLYTDDGVNIIKTTGYFNLSGKGLEEAGEKAKKLVENVTELCKKKTQGDEKKKNKIEEYKKGLLEWEYKDHLFIMLLLFVPGDTMYARDANLIEMQMKYKYSMKGKDFSLDKMATYIRVESSPSYTPVLPIPIIPGLNDKKIRIKNMHYSGY